MTMAVLLQYQGIGRREVDRRKFRLGAATTVSVTCLREDNGGKMVQGDAFALYYFDAQNTLNVRGFPRSITISMEKREINLKKSLRNMGITDDVVSQKDIEDFLACRDKVSLKKLMTELGLEDDFEDEFDEILLQSLQPLKAPQELLIEEDKPPVEIEQHFDEMEANLEESPTNQIFQKDKRMLQDLTSAAQFLGKIQANFSYKILSRLQLKIFEQQHPEILTSKPLELQKSEASFEEDIKLLREAITSEDKMSQSIDKSFLEMETLNPINVVRGFRRIKEELVPVDIQYLSKLIERNTSSGKKTQKQSGIVFIGVTGSGKSTTILSLLGNRMKMALWKGQQWVTTESQISDSDAKNLIANPSTVSVTREVTAVEIPEKILLEAGSLKSGGIFFVDTPGFEDTEGAVMDLANAFGVSKAIKGLDEARFVIVVGGLGVGDRYQLFQRLANILNDLFPNYKSVRGAITLLFNRFTPEILKEIPLKIQSIFKELPETKRGNKNLTEIYEDLIRKTKKPIINFDPIHSNPATIIQTILEADPAKELGKFFSISFGTNAKNAVEKQTRLLSDFCLTYFQKQEFEVCIYFFMQIKVFSTMMAEYTPEVVFETLQRLKALFKEKIESECTETLTSFSKRVNSRSLTKDDIAKYKQVISMSNKYDKFPVDIEIPNVKDRLSKSVASLIESLIREMKENLEVEQSPKEIATLKLLLSSFDNQKSRSEIIEFYTMRLGTLRNSYSQYIKETRYNDSVPDYKQHAAISKVLTRFLEGSEEKIQMEGLDNIIIDSIKQKCETATRLANEAFNLDRCDIEYFNNIKNISGDLKNLEKSYEFWRTISNTAKIEEILIVFKNTLTDQAEKLLRSIEEYIDQLTPKENLGDSAERKIINSNKKITFMKDIPHLTAFVTSKESNIKTKLKNCVDAQEQILNNFIKAFKEKTYILIVMMRQIDRVNNASRRIEKLSQLYPAEEGTLDSVASSIEEFLVDTLSSLETIRATKLNFGSDEIVKAMEILSKIYDVITAFRMNSRPENETSEVFKRENITELLKSIKEKGQTVFHNNIQEAYKAVRRLKEEGARETGEKPTGEKPTGEKPTGEKPTGEKYIGEKYKDVRFSEINSCLNFVLMGMKMFSNLKEAQQFEEIYKQLCEQLKKWFSVTCSNIKVLKDQLGKTSNDSLKASCVSLKKKLQILFDISQKWVEIAKILDLDYYDYMKSNITDDLNTTHNDLHQKIEKALKLKGDDGKITDLIATARILSILDGFCETNNLFKDLEAESKDQNNRLLETQEKKFEAAIMYENYSEMCQLLGSFITNQNGLEKTSEGQINDVFCKLLTRIKKQIGKGFSPSEMEALIDLSENLTQGRDSLQKISNLNLSNPLVKILKDMNKTLEEISSNITDEYCKIIGQIKSYLANGSIEEAHLHISTLEKLEKILNGTPAYIKILEKNQDKGKESEHIRKQMNETIASYYDKYVSKDSSSQELKEKYSILFPGPVLTNRELLGLREQIIKKVKTSIQNKLEEVNDMKYVTQSYEKDVNIFLKTLPEELIKGEGKALLAEVKRRVSKWEQEKKELDNVMLKQEVIVGGYLNVGVYEYFKNGEIEQIKKNALKTKIEDNLKRVVVEKATSCSCLASFLSQMLKTKEVQIPKTPMCDQIDQIFKNIRIMIEGKSIEIEQKEIKTMEISLFSKDDSYDLKAKFAQQDLFVSNLLESMSQLNTAFETNLLSSEDVKAKWKNALLEFVQRVKEEHTRLKKRIHIKQISNIEGSTASKITESSKVLKKLNSVEHFITLLFKEIQSVKEKNLLSEVLQFLMEEGKEGEKQVTSMLGLEIAAYEDKIINQVSVKQANLLSMSLNGDIVANMDESGLKKHLKETHSLITTFKAVLRPLYEALGRKGADDTITNIEKLKQNLDAEARSIKEEVLNFASDPDCSSADTLERIRKKIMILVIYSDYLFELKTATVEFDEKLKKYSLGLKEIAFKALEDLDKIKQNTESNIAMLRSQNEQNKTKINQDIDKNFQQKKAHLQDAFNNNTQAEPDPLKKQQLVIKFNNEVESESNMAKENKIFRGKQLDEELSKKSKPLEEATEQKLVEVAKVLEKVCILDHNIPMNSNFHNIQIEIIKEVKNKGKAVWFKKLGDILSQIETFYTGLILSSNPEFAQLRQARFRKALENRTINDILVEMGEGPDKLNSTMISSLNTNYAFFKKQYDANIAQYNSEQIRTKEELIKSIKRQTNKDASSNDSIKLLAQIFALWSILKSTYDDGIIEYNFNPHPAQVITLFLLLGLLDVQECRGLLNRFAEVKTGEGKSMILGGLSAFLAIKGFNVDCVCYSKFLSQRDEAFFKDLFDSLGVRGKIKYCTFNELTERLIKNEQLDLRKVGDEILNDSSAFTRQIKSFIGYLSKAVGVRPITTTIPDSVLILDQADVFFISEFYGNTYTPSAQLRSEAIGNLMSWIWEKRDDKSLSKNMIISSDVFKKCLEKYPHLKELLKNQVGPMISGVRNYKHDYQVIDNKIAYKDQDGFSSAISFGYKTLFAYFYEFDKKNITEITSATNVINLALCEISYAELPKMYEHIFGVTGTLRDLPEIKKEIMKKEYKIMNNYYIPSVYNKSKRLNEGIKIVSQADHFKAIVENLKDKFDLQRPVLIFFDNLMQACIFFNSEEFRPFKDKAVILDEKHNTVEREHRITRAMRSNCISLLTKSFGRGTDFTILEKIVKTNGGAYLIAAVLPDDKSEQVQIKGRVARIDDPGSFVFILTEENVQSMTNLKPSDYRKLTSDQTFQIIDEAREMVLRSEYSKIQEVVTESMRKHLQAMMLITNIYHSQLDSSLKYIFEINKVPQISVINPVKTILAIDATGSMSSALSITTTTLAEAFRRVYEILQEKHVENGFEMQIVVYRNYNCNESDLLEMSPFETTTNKLQQFIKKVKPIGGMGNEAMQVMYDHSLKQENLKQIIIIGDAPSNDEQQTILKRKNTNGGEKYWSKTKFSSPVSAEQRFGKLVEKGVLVHTLPIPKYGPAAQKYMKNVSERSKGSCRIFEPDSSDAATVLTDFMSQCILKQQGNSSQEGEELVEAYKRKYRTA